MRTNASGLVMIGASLLVCFTVVGLVAQREVELRDEQIRAEGLRLANSLSRVPLNRLAPETHGISSLQLLGVNRRDSLFAYAMVVDRTGATLSRISSPELQAPEAHFAAEPPAWPEERVLRLDGIDDEPRVVREFLAPVIVDGEIAAQVRVAFLVPDLGVALEAASFHATVSLLIFLHSPLMFMSMRRAMRPLTEAACELETVSSGDQEMVSSTDASSTTPRALADRLRAVTERVQGRGEAMARERMALLASTKVLTFQKNRVETVFESYPDAILALDGTGKLTVANARAEAVLRVNREELIDAPLSVWSPAPEVTELVGRYTKSAGQMVRAEAVEFSSDELDTRRFVASIHPLPEAAGAVVAVRDITLEFAARKNQAEFLGHMAHELKAPLSVMSMYSEHLLENEGSEADRIDACNVIRDEIDRLNGLINNIFSIGRIEAGNVTLDRQRIRTRELLADTFDSVSRGGGEREIEFNLELPETISPIFADKQLLSVAVKNLLTNAVKYNRDGGKVWLVAEEQDEGLYVRVIDNGIGIPEEEIERIFDKFYRSEDASTQKVAGHGLGLALVKEIIALHGGEIQVQSAHGEGTEFTFFFDKNSAIFRGEANA